MPLGSINIRVGANIKDFNTKMQSVSRTLKRTGRQMQNAGRSMSRSLTAPLVIAGGLAVRSFAKFDSAMTQSLAIMSGVTPEIRKQMESVAKTMSTQLGLATEEAAKSYFYLASAGLDAAQSIKALPIVAKFAKAGMFDMALATDLATDAQSALGLRAKDATQNMNNLVRVTDVLVKANTLANATVEQFSTALTNKAGASIKSVGKSIEEGVAVLAAFADQGVKGEEAGTKLSIVMRDLQTKAIKHKSAFEQAGLSVFDASGEMRNMGDIVGDLEGYLGNMSDEQKKASLLMLGFSDKSIAATQALLGTSEQIKEYQRQLENATGFTDKVAAAQMSSFTEKLNVLKAELQVLAINVAPIIIDKFLLPIMAGVKNLVDRINSLNSAQKKLMIRIAAIVAIAGPVVVIFGKLFTGIGAIIKITPLLIGGIKKLGLALKGLAANPLGAVIMAIAAVVFATQMLVKHWDKIVPFFQKVWLNVKLAFQTTIQGILKTLGKFGKFLGVDFSKSIAKLGTKIEATKKAIKALEKTQEKATETTEDAAFTVEDLNKMNEEAAKKEAERTAATNAAAEATRKLTEAEKLRIEQQKQIDRLKATTGKKGFKLAMAEEEIDYQQKVEDAGTNQVLLEELEKKHEQNKADIRKEYADKHKENQQRGIEESDKMFEDSANEKIKINEDILRKIQNNELDSLAKIRAARDYDLEHFTGTEEEKAKIAKYYDGLISEVKQENSQRGLDAAQQGLAVLGTLFEASKNRQLAAAEGNEKKMAEINAKFAKREKGVAIVSSIINTAQGVTKAFAQGGIFGYITGALIAAAGAAQIALISSQQIPAYAMGTNYASGGLSLVGERGAELLNIPRGSQVIPNHKLGGLQLVQVYGNIAGSSIRISNDRSQQRRDRVI